jgi:hypothetical protein
MYVCVCELTLQTPLPLSLSDFRFTNQTRSYSRIDLRSHSEGFRLESRLTYPEIFL